MQFIRKMICNIKSFLCQSNAPKGKWKSEFLFGTIHNNAQGKPVFIDSTSQAEYSIDLPHELKKSNNIKIALGRVYKGTDNPVLSSYIDISKYQAEFLRSQKKLTVSNIRDYPNQGLSNFLIFLFKGNWINALVAIILPYLGFAYINDFVNNPDFILIPAIGILTILFVLCVILKQWFGIVFLVAASLSYYILLKNSDVIIYLSIIFSGPISLLLFYVFISKKFTGISKLFSNNFHNLIYTNYMLLFPKACLALFLVSNGFRKSFAYCIAIGCIDVACMIYYLFPRKIVTDRIADHYLNTLNRFHKRLLDKTLEYIPSISSNIEIIPFNANEAYPNDISKLEKKQNKLSVNNKELISMTSELSQQIYNLNQNLSNINKELGITKFDIADILVKSGYKKFGKEYMKIAEDYRSIFNGSRLKDYSLDPIGETKTPRGEKIQPTMVYPFERGILIICETLQRIKKTNPAIKDITDEELTSLLKARAIRSYNDLK